VKTGRGAGSRDSRPLAKHLAAPAETVLAERVAAGAPAGSPRGSFTAERHLLLTQRLSSNSVLQGWAGQAARPAREGPTDSGPQALGSQAQLGA